MFGKKFLDKFNTDFIFFEVFRKSYIFFFFRKCGKIL